MKLVEDLFDHQKVNLKGQTMNDDDIAYPCGLIGKYIFNDAFAFYEGAKQIEIDDDDTMHYYHKGQYNNQDGDYKAKQFIDMDTEFVANWFQMESNPNFIKLYARPK